MTFLFGYDAMALFLQRLSVETILQFFAKDDEENEECAGGGDELLRSL